MNDTNIDPSILGEELELPCGVTIKNRILKSAMSEIMGSSDNRPTHSLARLYGRWAEGGVGLLMTGNVMVDRKALGEPRNVVMDRADDLEMLSSWAAHARKNGTHVWVQLNHPGRQSPSFLSPEPVAPSAIPYDSDLKHMFRTPRALTETEIEEIIAKFARSAVIAKTAGFTGVQIHGAHGYLVSQFLSPLYNRREDGWGGAIEGRMRFAMEVYRAIRNAVGPRFPIGIKINSSDFQKNGFSEEDALAVIQALADEGIDLIEISGGNYESPVMTGTTSAVKAQKPYFLDFAEKAAERVDTPIALTGGFRNGAAMAEAVGTTGVVMAGLGRPMAVDPAMPKKVLSGQPYTSPVKPLTTGFKALDRMAMLEITWYENQMRYMGMGMDPRPDENVYKTVFKIFKNMGAVAFKRRRA
jgi:2,4-dienoyl-CoA reductase-like NADH-dependent reductase (Old Yellow Enzyme family)